MVYDTHITIAFMGFINHQTSLGGAHIVPRSPLINHDYPYWNVEFQLKHVRIGQVTYEFTMDWGNKHPVAIIGYCLGRVLTHSHIVESANCSKVNWNLAMFFGPKGWILSMKIGFQSSNMDLSLQRKDRTNKNFDVQTTNCEPRFIH